MAKSKNTAAATIILPATTPEHFNAAVYGILYEAAAAGAASGSLMEQAKQKGEGCYTMAVKAAVACIAANPECPLSEGRPMFAETIGSLEEMIRTRADVARAIGAKANKDGTAFVIPGSLMNAKSIILGAFDNGVSFTDDAGNPVAFGKIRDAVAKAKAAKAAEKEKEAAAKDPAKADAIEIRETLAALVEGMGKTMPEGFPEILASLKAARAVQLKFRKPDAAAKAADTLAAAMLPNGRAAGQTKATPAKAA
jgi:hypothetical protein